MLYDSFGGPLQLGVVLVYCYYSKFTDNATYSYHLSYQILRQDPRSLYFKFDIDLL